MQLNRAAQSDAFRSTLYALTHSAPGRGRYLCQICAFLPLNRLKASGFPLWPNCEASAASGFSFDF